MRVLFDVIVEDVTIRRLVLAQGVGSAVETICNLVLKVSELGRRQLRLVGDASVESRQIVGSLNVDEYHIWRGRCCVNVNVLDIGVKDEEIGQLVGTRSRQLEQIEIVRQIVSNKGNDYCHSMTTRIMFCLR